MLQFVLKFPFIVTGKIKIQDILACSFLDDLLEVGPFCFSYHLCFQDHTSLFFSVKQTSAISIIFSENAQYHIAHFYSFPLALCSQLRDEELSKESQETNWFSAPSALRVYGEKKKKDFTFQQYIEKWLTIIILLVLFCFCHWPHLNYYFMVCFFL